MSSEDFLTVIAKAIRDDAIWVLLSRGIMVDCSESFLDFTELTKEELIGRDIYENPIQDLPNGHVIDKLTNRWRLYFNGAITGHLKCVEIQPYVYKDYRFSINYPQKVPWHLLSIPAVKVKTMR